MGRKSFSEQLEEFKGNIKEVSKGVFVSEGEYAFSIVESHGSENKYTMKHVSKKDLDYISKAI